MSQLLCRTYRTFNRQMWDPGFHASTASGRGWRLLRGQLRGWKAGFCPKGTVTSSLTKPSSAAPSGSEPTKRWHWKDTLRKEPGKLLPQESLVRSSLHAQNLRKCPWLKCSGNRGQHFCLPLQVHPAKHTPPHTPHNGGVSGVWTQANARKH